MDNLDPISVRVLGSLMEKEATTPDNYPLTLNSLVAACNQTSNRDPVMSLDESAVQRAIEDLRKRSLVRAVQRSDSRVMRYRHLMGDGMSTEEAAVMCVLMLRGAQTPGEIKGRTNRLYDFADLAQLESTLELLMKREFVARLPRRPGQKEVRYAHLLSGEPAAESDEAATEPAAPPVDEPRIDALERTVETLRAELADLRTRFEEFWKEFQ